MPTISDVANRAGVSPATVSRVLHGASNVRPDTRARVEHAIQQLGYVPSAVAQSLRSKRTRSIALLVSDVTNNFWTTVARGVEDVAQRHRYSVLLCNTDEDLAKQCQYLDVLIRQQVDGVIIAPYDSNPQHLDGLRSRNIPTVVVDRQVDGWDVDSVMSDSVAGSRALVQHLLSLGHRHIGVLSGPGTTSTAQDRIAGYCLALSEAGVPIDPRLIRHGEFRTTSGEELMHQLLDEGLAPSAIFAANNAIAMGVINALGKRGLRIPQDIALVCFDDLPDASHLFPFLTVVAQPVYDLGVNAAQLLLSRLETEATLRPRHVVLPSRLVVRHSCGSRLVKNGQCPLSLPVPGVVPEESRMVRPLGSDQRRSTSYVVTGQADSPPRGTGRLTDYDRSDVKRLLNAVQNQETDRVPHLELGQISRAILEYVLEREPAYDLVGSRVGGQEVTPEDHVDFALRLGIDAIPCCLSWRPESTDMADLQPAPSMADQLSYLERYLRAAEGTNVGIIACFSSFFDVALQTTGVMVALHRFRDEQTALEQMMDLLLQHQERVMRVLCDRFADDLALIMIHDQIAGQGGLVLPPDDFLTVYPARMTRLITPAREHGKPLLLHTAGKMSHALPMLHNLGFDAIHPPDLATNEILELKQDWAGRLALVGNFPTQLLVTGSRDEIEEAVRTICATLAPGGGYALSSSLDTFRDVPPRNYVTMVQAVHKYGRYGASGAEV